VRILSESNTDWVASDIFCVMNLRQITQFLAVVETQSFRKAAERLHMAQPPLSTGIRRLEADLDATLFERGRRGVRLTEAGAAILADAQKIAFHTEQLRKAASALRTGVGGLLRVGFIGSATYTLLPRALPVFRERYPKVVLDLREGTTAQILRDIEAGALDLGLIRYPIAQSTPLDVVPVEWDRLVAALPIDHPLSRRRRLALSDLANESFILYSAANAPSLRAQVMLACQAAGFSPRVTQEAVQVQTLVSLVESGIGVALVPAASGLGSTKRVAFRDLSADASLAVAIAVATPPDIESSAASRFREVLKESRPVASEEAIAAVVRKKKRKPRA
jgi:DNA-binding transcriptional LysR family regulator